MLTPLLLMHKRPDYEALPHMTVMNGGYELGDIVTVHRGDVVRGTMEENDGVIAGGWVATSTMDG
jgi:hypothetical protein